VNLPSIDGNPSTSCYTYAFDSKVTPDSITLHSVFTINKPYPALNVETTYTVTITLVEDTTKSSTFTYKLTLLCGAYTKLEFAETARTAGTLQEGDPLPAVLLPTII